LEQQLVALVQAGQLDSQTASLLKLAYSAHAGQRLGEDALRVMERRIGVKTMAYFRDMAERVAAAPNVPLDAGKEAALLNDVLLADLNATAQLGAKAVLITAAQEGVKIGFDWALANDGAAAWAEQYAATLARDLTETTLKQTQAALASFQRTPGMTRADLERLILQGPDGVTDLVGLNGRYYSAAERAEMIAVTETTRSYSAGGVEGMRSTGLDMVEPDPERTPPIHVNCRCTADPFPREDGVMSWKFLTANDDLVCDECGPLHGEDVGEK
jgi:hypothetical protein